MKITPHKLLRAIGPGKFIHVHPTIPSAMEKNMVGFVEHEKILTNIISLSGRDKMTSFSIILL